MSEKLTPQQHLAVHNRGGKLLVSAAAGSGKTKVLVDRLLKYITDPADPANLDEFLIITYTKAAASELRSKIAVKLTERIAMEPENLHLQKQMQRLYLTKISTVHGFCSDILREYAYKLDLAPDFRVADEMECREIRDQVMSDLLDRSYAQNGTDPDFLAFVDAQGFGRDDRLIPEILEKVYDSARCHLNPEEWLEKCRNDAEGEGNSEIEKTIWGSFLITDLKAYLSSQIRIFEECKKQLDATEGMEKPASNIQSTLVQLQTILEADSWDRIVSLRNVDYGRLTFPRKNPDPDLTERVKAVRSACKKGLERKFQAFSDDSDQIFRDMQQTSSSLHGLIRLVKQFDREFQTVKRGKRVLDFSDLEQKTLDLLLGKNRSCPTTVALEISRRFREIMVDEYQDSNGVQDAIFEALTRENQNCFLVGDVKQSIYQFRLADPGIFLEKYHQYKPAEDVNGKEGRKILLSHNFRSGPEIIDSVNDVFRTCMSPGVGGLHYGEAEALRQGIPHVELLDPAVELHAIDVQEDTYGEEAAFVADRIHTMLQEGTLVRKNDQLQRVQPQDIVILLRSPGSAARYFMQALESRGIRCSTGVGTDLLKAEEIHTLRGILQTILNPRLDIPLLSVLASPVFGFTADELAEIRSFRKKGSIYDALRWNNSAKTKEFLQVLDQLRKAARMHTITTLLETCFRLTKLDSIYASMPDGDRREENLRAFYQLAVDYEKGSLKDLSQFLDFLNSMEDKGLVTTGSSTADCVTIMSIHKSKGLEFPVVFLCNLSRRFNQESIRGQILCDKELGIGLSVADTERRIRYPSTAKRAIMVKMASDSISEEMRVLYVAMTRARDRLIMTYASQSLESDLKDLVLRQGFDSSELLCGEATCMGDWVLLAALAHTEAGVLHNLSGKPPRTHIGEYPWKICLSEASAMSPENNQRVENHADISRETLDRIRRGLLFSYPYRAATEAPSKQTATDRKGRMKDAEAAENTPEIRNIPRKWRKPSFLSGDASGTEYGNAMHTALQYIAYENCGSAESIAGELNRLVCNGCLTQQQADLLQPTAIEPFFRSELGSKLRQGAKHLREFKFSILDDGIHYDPSLQGEKVLLQGVVDCAILEEDGITVIDFKTDFVTEELLQIAVQRYSSQIRTYAEALEKIYEMPVKASYLYFFRLNRFVKV